MLASYHFTILSVCGTGSKTRILTFNYCNCLYGDFLHTAPKRSSSFNTVIGSIALFTMLAAISALASLGESGLLSMDSELLSSVFSVFDAQPNPWLLTFPTLLTPAFAVSDMEPVPLAVVQNGDNYELTGSWGVTVYEDGGSVYAIVAARLGNAIQIIDITDPYDLNAVATIRNSGSFELDDPTIVMFYDGDDGNDDNGDGNAYIVTTSHNSNLVQIIDVTDPANPTPAATIKTDGDSALDGALGMTIYEDGGRVYVVAVAHFGDTVQIIDVTDPANPAFAATFHNGDGFDLDGPGDVAVYKHDNRIYALVAVFDSNMISIIDITDTANPVAVTTIHDGTDIDLDGPWNITLHDDSDRTYALVAVRNSNLLQIIDITDPTNPAVTATVQDGDDVALAGPWGIAFYEDGDGSVYVLVTALNSNTIQIIDITDPTTPDVVTTVQDGDGFELVGPTGIVTYEHNNTSYAIVSTFLGHTVQVIQLDTGIPPTSDIVQSEVSGEEEKKDAEKISDSGGCLIATAAYGTELAPQVQKLRELRDSVVLDTVSGSAFMQEFNQIYYSFSPAIADIQRQSDVFNAVIRVSITPMMATLSIMNLANDSSELEVIGLGLSVIALNLTLYVGSPVFAGFLIRRYHSRV